MASAIGIAVATSVMTADAQTDDKKNFDQK
jgi:hypothetical protein